MRGVLVLLTALVLSVCLAGCGSTVPVTGSSEITTSTQTSKTSESESESESSVVTTAETSEEEIEESIDSMPGEMVLTINGTEVPVIWEDNDSVKALSKIAADGLVIKMSPYGGFEQVGPIGQSIDKADEEITTSPGDIVLYSGDQIVIFFGSNTWSYTKLGKIDLSEKELTDLLSKDAVDIGITVPEK